MGDATQQAAIEAILDSNPAPSEGTFNRIARALGSGDAPEPVLQRIEAALASWPDDVTRLAPWDWVARTCRGWKADALRLANQIDVRRKTFTDRHMTALAASPSVANIKTFTNDPRTKSDIGDAGCIALATSPHFIGLTRLKLWDANTVTEAGALALVRSPMMEGMEHLMLRFSRGMTNAVAEALLASDRLSALRHLDLTSSSMDEAHCQRLRDAPGLSGVVLMYL